jgi:hypothetical protein
VPRNGDRDHAGAANGNGGRDHAGAANADGAAGALAAELADRLTCAVLAMRYPVTDEFAIGLAGKLYELLAAQAQPLPRALGLALRRVIADPPTPACPALSAATPTLFGAAAAGLVLAAPARTQPRSFGTGGLKMAGFPAQPDRFVGRTAVMARASAALAAESGLPGVLLYGMPGAGKTACALELAYTHEHAFEALVWYKAPDEDADIRGALTEFALTLERELPGFQMVHLLEDPAKLAAFTPRLAELLELARVLIVVDNIESLLSQAGQWRDARWGPVIAATTGHAGLGRVILTSRRLPAELDAKVRVLTVDALSLDEALLLTRELPHLYALIGGTLPSLDQEAAGPWLGEYWTSPRGTPSCWNSPRARPPTRPAWPPWSKPAARPGGRPAGHHGGGRDRRRIRDDQAARRRPGGHRPGRGRSPPPRGLAAAPDRGDYLTASMTASDLVRYCRNTGRLAEALPLAERVLGYTRRAGVGPWTQLARQVERLQVLAVLGRNAEVLAEVHRLRAHMDALPAGLRYKYLAGDPAAIAVSQHNLGNYLTRHAGQPGAALAHHLAAALIRAITGSQGPEDSAHAAAENLRELGDDPAVPAQVAELCRQVGEVPGADLGELLGALTTAEAAGRVLQELLTRIRQLAAAPPAPLYQYLAAWDPVIAALLAARDGDRQAADTLGSELAEYEGSADWAALAAAPRAIHAGDTSPGLLTGLDPIDTAAATRALAAVAGQVTIPVRLWPAIPIRWLLASIVAAGRGDIKAARSARHDLDELAADRAALAEALGQILGGSRDLSLADRLTDPRRAGHRRDGARAHHRPDRIIMTSRGIA